MSAPTPGPAAPEASAVDLPPDVELVVTLMGAMASQTSSVNWSLIQSLNYGERRTRAQLALVRDRIMELTSQPYLPHPQAVQGALWPSDSAIDGWLEQHHDDWRDPASPFRRCWRCYECNL